MDVDKELEHFFEAIGPLSQQTLALLIRLPPSLRIHRRSRIAGYRTKNIPDKS